MEASVSNNPSENLSTDALNRGSKIHFQLNNYSKIKNRAIGREKDRDSNALSSCFATSAGSDDYGDYGGVADAAAVETERRKEEGNVLIIPLTTNSRSRLNLLQRKNEPTHMNQVTEDGSDQETDNPRTLEHGASNIDTDKDLIEAISREALGGDVKESLSINPSEVYSISASREDHEKVLFQQDIQQRAEDMTVDSSAYIQVPISEFGAAMLRGMGWKDTQKDTNGTKQDKIIIPRHPRLGLGAIPKRMGNVGGSLHEQDKVAPTTKSSQESYHSNVRGSMYERIQLLQNRLQIGSIVWVFVDDLDEAISSLNIKDRIRARVTQTNGVPGLDRIRLEIEGHSGKSISVNKKKLTLLSVDDVMKNPFKETQAITEAILKDQPSNHHIDNIHRGKKQHTDERESNSQHALEVNHSSKKHKSDRKGGNEKKSYEYSKLSQRPSWLLPHIRVRVISEKIKQGKIGND